MKTHDICCLSLVPYCKHIHTGVHTDVHTGGHPSVPTCMYGTAVDAHVVKMLLTLPVPAVSQCLCWECGYWEDKEDYGGRGGERERWRRGRGGQERRR